MAFRIASYTRIPSLDDLIALCAPLQNRSHSYIDENYCYMTAKMTTRNGKMIKKKKKHTKIKRI